MRKVLSALLLIGFLLAGCGRPPAPVIEAVTRVVATATPTAQPTDSPTSQPIPSPAATLASPPALSLGEPIYLGRGQIADAAFAADAATVAIGWGNGVSLWDVASAAERWWQPTSTPVIAVDVHPQGQAVAAALADGGILILDAATGSARRYPGAGPHAYWGDVAWSPDGRQIAFQFIGPRRSDPIYLLNVEDGPLGEVPGSRVDEGTVPVLVWSPDSQSITLASLSEACSTVVDVQTGEVLFALEFGGSCSPPHLAWSPDGSAFALADRVIDPRSGETVSKLQGGTSGYSLSNAGRPIRFSLDGAYLAAGGQVEMPNELPPIVVWDARTGDRVAQIGAEGETYDLARNRARVALAFDAAADHPVPGLLVLYEDGEVARWRFGDGPAEKTMLGQVEVTAASWLPFTWSADGRRLAAPFRYGGVVVWDVPAARLAQRFDPPFEMPVLSPDGHLAALANSETSELLVANVDTGEWLWTLPEARSLPLGSAAFSPDGTQVAYGSGNRAIVADLALGAQIAVLAGHPEGQSISRLIWSPDGSALVTASGEPGNDTALAPLILWVRGKDGSFSEAFRAETTRAGYSCCVPLALFNLTGDVVALESFPSSEAGDMQVIVYDLQAGKVLLTLQEHQLAAWIDDWTLLTSEAGYETRLTRWDVRSGESTIGSGHTQGDEVYAPGGLFYARPNMHDPYYVRGVEIHNWETAQAIDSDIYDSDVLRIQWPVGGQWVGALATNGVIVAWPIQISTR